MTAVKRQSGFHPNYEKFIIMTLFYLFFAGLFGLVFGSFLNVVIYRLPLGQSIVFPASHCPKCGKPIKVFDNIPVLSYIILRGKCRVCSEKISPVYPFIEFFTGVLAVTFFILNGFTLNFISDFFLGAILLTAAMIDYRYMIIPDKLNIAGAIIGLILCFIRGSGGVIRGFEGAAAGFLILTGMYLFGKIIFKREGVGFGDVKLAAVIGLFVGPLWVFICMANAIILGGIIGTVLIISGRGKAGKEIPFGPFIAAGGIFMLFFRAQILYLLGKYISLL